MIGPLAIVGVGDAERYPGLGATALACLVVIVAVVGWWWIVTSRLAGRARGSMLRFFGLYVAVAIVMCVKNALLLALGDGPLLWPAVVVEVVLAVGGMAAVR